MARIKQHLYPKIVCRTRKSKAVLAPKTTWQPRTRKDFNLKLSNRKVISTKATRSRKRFDRKLAILKKLIEKRKWFTMGPSIKLYDGRRICAVYERRVSRLVGELTETSRSLEIIQKDNLNNHKAIDWDVQVERSTRQLCRRKVKSGVPVRWSGLNDWAYCLSMVSSLALNPDQKQWSLLNATLEFVQASC